MLRAGSPYLFGSAGFLELRSFLGQDGALNRTDLKTDAAIDARVEIDPVEVRAFAVLALPLVDAGNRAGINAVSDSLAHVRNNGVRHETEETVGILGINPIELEPTTVLRQLFGTAAIGNGGELHQRPCAALMPTELSFKCGFERGS